MLGITEHLDHVSSFAILYLKFFVIGNNPLNFGAFVFGVIHMSLKDRTFNTILLSIIDGIVIT